MIIVSHNPFLHFSQTEPVCKFLVHKIELKFTFTEAVG